MHIITNISSSFPCLSPFKFFPINQFFFRLLYERDKGLEENSSLNPLRCTLLCYAPLCYARFTHSLGSQAPSLTLLTLSCGTVDVHERVHGNNQVCFCHYKHAHCNILFVSDDIVVGVVVINVVFHL